MDYLKKAEQTPQLAVVGVSGLESTLRNGYTRLDERQEERPYAASDCPCPCPPIVTLAVDVVFSPIE
jgi:hypothetical protein